MRNETYNGWYNYETWCINLWLTNEQALYNAMLACESREALKELVENLTDVNNEEGLRRLDIIQDLVNCTLSEVNYREIWKHVKQARAEQNLYESDKTINGMKHIEAQQES